MTTDHKSNFATIVLLGSIWGFAEATLGFGLHLLRRMVPIPGLPAYVLFPLAVVLMAAAVAATGKFTAAAAVSMVAAVIKLSSGVLPDVPWIFVVNPSLAILTEGAVVALVMGLFRPHERLFGVAGAAAVSFSWRALFLVLVLMLPVQKGMLMRGPVALAIFLGVDSGVNATTILILGKLGVSPDAVARFFSHVRTRLLAPAALVAAVAAEIGIAAAAG